MTMKKLVFALIVVAALLVVAMPAAAQGPRPVFMRAVGTNEDPFGGLPIVGSEKPAAMSSLIQLGANGDVPLSGGIPSDKSGDGTSPRKAIYIGSAWAAQSPTKGFVIDAGEHPQEIPSCVTLKIPAGQNRWFKFDSWAWAPTKLNINGYPVYQQVWLDDELDGATKSSGSAVFGAASQYMYGTQAWDGWQKNADAAGDNTSYGGNRGGTNGNWNGMAGPHAEGFVMFYYGPDMLMPNFAFNAPNAWLFTVTTGSSGSLNRSAPYPPEGGVSDSQYCQWNTNSTSNPPVTDNRCYQYMGYGQYNPAQPSHLLWYESRQQGWGFVRVLDQMVWDATASVCSYRSVRTLAPGSTP
jgi:hypothetical protein